MFTVDQKSIVILVGANDMGQKHMEQVRDNMQQLLDLLQKLNPAAEIFLCEVLPRTHWSSGWYYPLRHVIDPTSCAYKFNKELRKTFGRAGIPLFRHFITSEGNANRALFKNHDGLHPNLSGRKILEKYISLYVTFNSKKTSGTSKIHALVRPSPPHSDKGTGMIKLII